MTHEKLSYDQLQQLSQDPAYKESIEALVPEEYHVVAGKVVESHNHRYSLKNFDKSHIVTSAVEQEAVVHLYGEYWHGTCKKRHVDTGPVT
jgi:hypothetical protein